MKRLLYSVLGLVLLSGLSLVVLRMNTTPPAVAASHSAMQAIVSPTEQPSVADPLAELKIGKMVAFNAIAASCHTTADALHAAMWAGGASPLALCQKTNPAATVDSLHAAVTAALTNQFNADVATGKTTAAEASTVLSDMQSHTDSWLTNIPNSGK